MRKVGTFFGGVLVVDGILVIAMSASNPTLGGGLGWAMLIPGALLALASLGRIVKMPDESWVSWVLGLVGGVVFAGFYALGVVATFMFAMMPGGSTPRKAVTKYSAKRFDEPAKRKRHYDKLGNLTGKTVDGKHYDKLGDYSGKTVDGKHYDKLGDYSGKTVDGKHYDKLGDYSGKTVDGKHYDKLGNPVGQTSES